MYEIDAGVEKSLREKALAKLLALKLMEESEAFHGYESAQRQADRTLSVYLQGKAGELTYKDLERHDTLLDRYESLTGESFEDSYEECKSETEGLPTPILALAV